jgi:hypothetical protein
MVMVSAEVLVVGARRGKKRALVAVSVAEVGGLAAAGGGGYFKRKFDGETRARAVRMHRDRLRDRGESKVAARRQVGAGYQRVGQRWTVA